MVNASSVDDYLTTPHLLPHRVLHSTRPNDYFIVGDIVNAQKLQSFAIVMNNALKVFPIW